MKALLGLLVTYMVISMLGCNGTFGETREQIMVKVAKAGESRASLWSALERDRSHFTAEDWSTLEGAHGQAIELSAAVEVGLTQSTDLDIEEVKLWRTWGQASLAAAELVLTHDKLAALSPQTRASWAVEKARLSALDRSAAQYLENPNASTYRALAQAGLMIVGGVL